MMLVTQPQKRRERRKGVSEMRVLIFLARCPLVVLALLLMVVSTAFFIPASFIAMADDWLADKGRK